MSKFRRGFLLASLSVWAALAASPVRAECTELFYSVNDYGKEGPARDAQLLLDRFIAEWAKKKGIKKYRIGKKEVECELFLDFILFDEHTCKATAKVCW